MAETAFSVMFGATVVYVVLGSYLYLAKILPALDKPAALLPSGQLRDVERYLEILEGQARRPWYGPILRHVRLITIIYLIGFAISIVLIYID